MGGGFRFGMESLTREKHVVRGTYKVIKVPERLEFTHTWEDADGNPGHETLVTVTFAAEGAKARMTFRQAGFDSAESRNGHEDGWGQCFGKLTDMLGQQPQKRAAS